MRRDDRVGSGAVADAGRRESADEEIAGGADGGRVGAEGSAEKAGPVRESLCCVGGADGRPRLFWESLLQAGRGQPIGGAISALRGENDAVRERMREIANERLRFGYRRLAILLRYEGNGMKLRKSVPALSRGALTVDKRGGPKRALGVRAPMAIPKALNPRW